jgi:cytochrome c oxidase subunit 2
MNRTMVVFNLIYLGLVVVGLAIFATIFLSTRARARAKPMNIARWKRRENVWFGVVVVALVGAAAATIFKTPWNADARAGQQEVDVLAQQYGFTFSTTKIKAGRQVEFRLKAKDVNHAFAIYDPSGTFVAQAQMMPDHPSTLRLTLKRPGVYAVRCFEYCGIGHHTMITSFQVVA